MPSHAGVTGIRENCQLDFMEPHPQTPPTSSLLLQVVGGACIGMIYLRSQVFSILQFLQTTSDHKGGEVGRDWEHGVTRKIGRAWDKAKKCTQTHTHTYVHIHTHHTPHTYTHNSLSSIIQIVLKCNHQQGSHVAPVKETQSET